VQQNPTKVMPLLQDVKLHSSHNKLIQNLHKVLFVVLILPVSMSTTFKKKLKTAGLLPFCCKKSNLIQYTEPSTPRKLKCTTTIEAYNMQTTS
jgi:hypothetical protein